MKRYSLIVFIFALVIVSCFLSTGCMFIKAYFDPAGYQYAVTILDDSVNLMPKAKESYDKYQEQVYALMTRVEAAYEHSRLKIKNDAVIGIWDQMRDPLGSRLGRFMELWKIENILDDETIKKYTKWVTDDLTALIALENKKKKL